MDTQGKVTSGFQKVLKTIGSFGRPSSFSSSMSSGPASGEVYQKLLDSESEISAETLETSTTHRKGGFWQKMRRVSKGHVPVYVGPERKRFVIRIDSLSHPLFKALLDQETSDIERLGGLTLECDPNIFEQLLLLIDSQCASHK